MGEDITKEQLKKEIQDILKDADLDNTSAKKVHLLSIVCFMIPIT